MELLIQTGYPINDPYFIYLQTFYSYDGQRPTTNTCEFNLSNEVTFS